MIRGNNPEIISPKNEAGNVSISTQLKVKQDMKYKVIDKYITPKNIDRIKFYSPSYNKSISVISAGYHLENKTKTGGLFFFSTTAEGKFKHEKELLLDYGIWDMKFKNDLIFTSNSDTSYSIFDIENKTNVNYFINQERKPSETTCNIIEWFPSARTSNNCSNLLIGDSEGYHHIIDAENNSIVSSIKGHDYSWWASLFLDDNWYFTGSEDGLIKQWDNRTNKSVGTNKSHKSGVTCWYSLDIDNNVLFTGSYDNEIIWLDIRNFPSDLKTFKTDHAVWDMKQKKFKGRDLWFMSSIYEGINIWEVKQDITMEHIWNIAVDKGKSDTHGTIVYGVDVKNIEGNSGYVDWVTCSFYDNCMLHWHFYG